MPNLFILKKQSSRFSTDNIRGFTLIETLIASSIFVFVMFIATNAILSLVGANANVRSQENMMNNLGFVFDELSRSIRMGTSYHCGDGNVGGGYDKPYNCPTGADTFAFEPFGGNPNNAGDQVVYTLCHASPCTGIVEKSVDGGATFSYLTAPEITIDKLTFYVTGAGNPDVGGSGNNTQPKALITISGHDNGGAKIKFNLQTSTAQRVWDI